MSGRTEATPPGQSRREPDGGEAKRPEAAVSINAEALNRLGSGRTSAGHGPNGVLAGLLGSASHNTRRTTAHEFVRDSLRRAIISGRLGPGVTLTQSQIAEALGVSTTPVREALRDLATERLVDIDNYRTTSIHRPSVRELEEVYDLRRMLETYAIRKIVEQVDERVLDQAAAIQERMDRQTDTAEWLLLNAEFHTVLNSTLDAPRLNGFLETLRSSVAMYVGMALREKPERLEESNAEHREVIAACRARDVDRAVRVTELHMDPTKLAVQSVLLAE